MAGPISPLREPSPLWFIRASMPFKPAQGHRLQVKISLLMFYGKLSHNFNYHKIRSFSTPDRRQFKTLWASDECGSQISRTSVFDCHLSPVGQQMAINNYISNDLWSTFVNSKNNFDCCLSGMFIWYKNNQKQGLGVTFVFTFFMFQL